MGFLKDNVHLEISTWNDRSGSLFLDFFALLFVKKSCNLFPSGISSQLEIFTWKYRSGPHFWTFTLLFTSQRCRCAIYFQLVFFSQLEVNFSMLLFTWNRRRQTVVVKPSSSLNLFPTGMVQSVGNKLFVRSGS